MGDARGGQISLAGSQHLARHLQLAQGNKALDPWPPRVSYMAVCRENLLNDTDQSKFPIGGGDASIRAQSICAHSWLNWLYLIDF